MAVRNDITVKQELSPRLAEIDAGSNELTVQDAHDTLTGIQDSTTGSEFPDLISTAGKEDLGGGVTVGLTSSLKDVQIAPSSTAPRETGAVTAGDASGVTLTDSGATFVTNGVQRGDWVLNWDDHSVTEVISVTSETELVTRGLRNGTLNQFTVADAYDVYEVAEFDLAGGNIVASDAADLAINPVFSSFGRFITRTSSSSATLQELQDIQFASFGGGVWVDAVGGVSGTVFPTGTERQPCNNFTDAYDIAIERGFNRIYILGDATIGTANTFADFEFVGQGNNLTNITIPAVANVVNCIFRLATITGTLDGGSYIRSCTIDTLDYVSGVVEDCILGATTITLSGNEVAHFLNCFSGVPGTGTPVIDLGGSGQDLAIRNYNGGIKLVNKTGSDSVSVDMNSGQLVIETSTVTAGTIVARGVGKVVNTSNEWLKSGDYGSLTLINEIQGSPSVQLLEPNYTVERANRLMLSAAAAKISGADTTEVKIRDINDTKDRIVASVDSFGNRTSVNVDAD